LGRPPGLSVILVGDDPASAVYVRNKQRTAERIGMRSELLRLPADSTMGDIALEIDRLNADDNVDGILLQLPIPDGLEQQVLVERISPTKDVDGFHPINIGRAMAGEEDAFVPCTPRAVQRILTDYGYELRGKHVVIVGRGFVVGKPLAMLLLRKGGAGGDATVTVAHSRSGDLAAITRTADVIVAAVGRANTITADMVKPGAAVIDVGIVRVPDANAPKGSRLVGDVDYDAVAEVAGAITPVPGGVGPMTVAMLMQNTVTSARQRIASLSTMR
jgi:methylenetetrahydrofolate dehydrogenase (NADP+)/methenyltetrahydrofolate cyclohydrolase